MKKIAVLMTCYNRVQTTLQALGELFDQKIPAGYEVDVWLVDDASPDQTGDKVLEWFHSQSNNFSLQIIRGTGSLFWCRGMRLAWDKAAEAYDYDFYMWLNDDTHLNPDAIACLTSDYEKVAPNGEPATIVGSFYTAQDSTFISYGTSDGRGRIVPNGKPQRVEKGGVMAGNCVLISKSVYRAIGPIYGGYHHGGGDYDYAATMHEHDIPFYCASKVNGWCKANHTNFTFKGKNLWQRLKLLGDPKGVSLHDTWVARVRHRGYLRAIVSVCHVIGIAIRGKDVC